MYAVLELHYKPSEFHQLPKGEKALLIAMIDLRLEAEEAERRKHKK